MFSILTSVACNKIKLSSVFSPLSALHQYQPHQSTIQLHLSTSINSTLFTHVFFLVINFIFQVSVIQRRLISLNRLQLLQMAFVSGASFSLSVGLLTIWRQNQGQLNLPTSASSPKSYLDMSLSIIASSLEKSESVLGSKFERSRAETTTAMRQQTKVIRAMFSKYRHV